MFFNIRRLTDGISSAQSSISHCKSTLKSIECELMKLEKINASSHRQCSNSEMSYESNTNNQGKKKLFEIKKDFNDALECSNAYEDNDNDDQGCEFNNAPLLKHYDTILVETDQFQNHKSNVEQYDVTNMRQRNIKHSPKVLQQEPAFQNDLENTSGNNCHGAHFKQSSICNDIENILLAQEKMICQIDRLKMDIGQKTCLIDNCVKDSQFFCCKFKQIDFEMSNLRNELCTVRKQVECHGLGLKPTTPTNEMPQSSHINDSFKKHNGSGNLRSEKRKKTLDDVLKKSRVGIECNTNNAAIATTNNNASINSGPSIMVVPVTALQNNQSSATMPHKNKGFKHANVDENYISKSSIIMSEFHYLTKQIKNLRKLTETLFKRNSLNNVQKCPRIQTTLSLLSKSKQPLDSRKHQSKIINETGKSPPHENLSSSSSFTGSSTSLSSSSLSSHSEVHEDDLDIRKINYLLQCSTDYTDPVTVNPINKPIKTRSSHTNAATSDTSCCILTEDQLATQTYGLPSNNHNNTRAAKLSHKDKNTSFVMHRYRCQCSNFVDQPNSHIHNHTKNQ